ncbi:hypothetical protein [Tellurirhabdus bombi]|uniref:hypothetical protein n=1 Tax=Tellurirhabdus bombi TaxID=2907205 RepID=UPI001F2B49B5|nr:hypothetical protein [Tellurirhabdus bombi]
MKTSNKLLIGLLAVVVLAMFGFNTVLKSEYKKIDLTDEFYGFDRQTVAPFKVIKIEGSNHQFVEIRSGKDYAFRLEKHHQEDSKVTHRVVGDTLVVTIPIPKDYRPYEAGTSSRWGKPVAYIIAPSLEGIRVSGATGKLANWQANDLNVIVSDSAGGLLLEKTNIRNLRATVEKTSLLEAGRPNQIGNATISVKNNARFISRTAQIDALSVQADTSAMVELPGALLSKLK